MTVDQRCHRERCRPSRSSARRQTDSLTRFSGGSGAGTLFFVGVTDRRASDGFGGGREGGGGVFGGVC